MHINSLWYWSDAVKEKDTIKAHLSDFISERLGAVFCQEIEDELLNYVIHSAQSF